MNDKELEQSFIRGAPRSVERHLPGSVRVDVVWRYHGVPATIYDLKIGKSVLTKSRLRKIVEAVGIPKIQVFELRAETGTAVRRK